MASTEFPIAQTGKALFLSQLVVIERVISFVSSRHHLPGLDADDFASHVKLKLIEDDYDPQEVSGSHASDLPHRRHPATVSRLPISVGKWRPSAKPARAIAILLEQLIGRDGFSFEEACELLETNHQVTASRSDLAEIAGRLPIRIRRKFESDSALAQVPSDQPPVDDVIAEQERTATAARVGVALKSAMAGLDPQDRLILALRFEDGRSIVDVARMLRLDQKALYRRLDRVMKALRGALHAEGVDSAVALEIFESPAVSIDWRGETKGTSKSRPSMGQGGQEWR
jgi:RNA polymerase sigma factor for flagellar operon FliA